MIKNLKLIILGSDLWLIDVLEVISFQNPIEIVFLHKDKNNKIAINKLEKLKINYKIVENINKYLKLLKKLKPDLILCFAFPDILSKNLISIPKLGIINFHASDLPRFRGRHPVNWAMIQCEKEVGVCAHFINEKIDMGDIVLRDTITVDRDDIISEVLKKIRLKIQLLSIKVINQFKEKSIKRTIQDHSLGTYQRKRKPKDSKIDWENSTFQLHRFINALTDPYPNAFCFLSKNKVELKKSIIGKKIGQVIAKTTDGKFVISAKDGVILVETNQKLKIGEILN